MTRLTTDMLGEILLKAGKLTPEQAREIRIKQDHQRMKILKSRGETIHRGRVHLEDEVSAIEVAASLEFEQAGAPERSLPRTSLPRPSPCTSACPLERSIP